MNKRLTFKLIGKVLLVEAALMLVPLAVSLILGGGDAVAMLIAMLVTAAVGGGLSIIPTRNDNLRARDGFAVVSFSWLLVSFFGALPFWIHGCIPSLLDAFFETVSGFTTTGATILTDVEALPAGMLFWRSFTHWVGGMGVLVLSLALLPKMGTRSIYLMRAESPGPSVDKLVPRVGNNAKILYQLYVWLSVLMLIALLCTGMNLYDALIHVFGAAGTGGFSNYNASVGAFDSAAVEIIIGVFMALFGVNFSMYYYMLRRNWRVCTSNSELRAYVGLVLGASVLIALNIMPQYGGKFFTSLRYSFFQVSSVMTTTGYATADFDAWPSLAKAVLLILMFFGGCMGSTAGGLKMSRVTVLAQIARNDLRHALRPREVSSVILNGRRVDAQGERQILSYFALYIAVIGAVFLLISFEPFGIETNFSATVSCVNNIGPGFGQVGPSLSFAGYSAFSKLVLSFAMLLGRLEIYPLLLLLSPQLWTKR